jgi:hypothetical protein
MRLLETGTGPWLTPMGYLQTAILKPEPKRNFQLLPSAVKHRVGAWQLAYRATPMGKGVEGGEQSVVPP